MWIVLEYHLFVDSRICYHIYSMNFFFRRASSEDKDEKGTKLIRFHYDKSCTLLCGHNSSLQTKIAKLRTIQLFVLPL